MTTAIIVPIQKCEAYKVVLSFESIPFCLHPKTQMVQNVSSGQSCCIGCRQHVHIFVCLHPKRIIRLGESCQNWALLVNLKPLFCHCSVYFSPKMCSEMCFSTLTYCPCTVKTEAAAHQQTVVDIDFQPFKQKLRPLPFISVLSAH